MVSPGENITDSASQTDADMLSGSCGPDCEARFEVKLRDFRSRIERELNDQMQVAMRKLEERVCAATCYSVILVGLSHKKSAGNDACSFFVLLYSEFI